jgi:Mrp family chromosome partitioning ATPase
VNCDFRRPSIHRYFGVDDVPRHVHETRYANVEVVTNVLADAASNPTQVVAAQRQVVAAARGRFDVILLDTARLLTANDAVDLVNAVDLVLLVARLGTTRSDDAARTRELLDRIDVPLAGVVLVGATGASNDTTTTNPDGCPCPRCKEAARPTVPRTERARSDDAVVFDQRGSERRPSEGSAAQGGKSSPST